MTVRERLAAIAARGAADGEDTKLCWEALGSAHKADQRAAADALVAVARRGRDLEALLDRALADRSPRRRWGAAYVCAQLGPVPVRCLPVLLDTLAEPDGDLRWASLAILREQRGLPGLRDALHALARGQRALQRKMALYCLRDLGQRDATLEGELVAALDDGDAGVRLAAMSALVALADDGQGAAAALTRRLEDSDAGVRRAAAASLGRLGVAGPLVEAALERAGLASDRSLARAAAAALGALRGRAGGR